MKKETIQAILAKHLNEKRKIEDIWLNNNNLLGYVEETDCYIEKRSPVEVQHEDGYLVLKGHRYRYDKYNRKVEYDYDFIEYVAYTTIKEILVNYKK